MSNLIPIPMNGDELASVLNDIAMRVVTGDSFEGNIEYMIPIAEGDPPKGWGQWPSTDCQFWVTGVYRTGNREGQGGMRMIGKVPGL